MRCSIRVTFVESHVLIVTGDAEFFDKADSLAVSSTLRGLLRYAGSCAAGASGRAADGGQLDGTSVGFVA